MKIEEKGPAPPAPAPPSSVPEKSQSNQNSADSNAPTSSAPASILVSTTDKTERRSSSTAKTVSIAVDHEKTSFGETKVDSKPSRLSEMEIEIFQLKAKLERAESRLV
jgi:hypothetical protein